jgi:hypothetical protein
MGDPSRRSDRAKQETGGSTSVGARRPDRAASSVYDLDLSSASSEEIAGRFVLNGQGLEFASTLDGDVASLKVATVSGYEILSISDDGESRTASYVSGALQVTLPKFALPEEFGPDSATDFLPKPQLIRGNYPTFERLLAVPEFATLPTLSRALGFLGVTGDAFPSALGLHYAGMCAARFLRDRGHVDRLPPEPDKPQPKPIYRLPDPMRNGLVNFRLNIEDFLEWDPAQCIEVEPPYSGDYTQEAWEYIMDRLPQPCGDRRPCNDYPNRDDECFGMCGDGCNCWRWVCGDCCWHPGCAAHDAFCRSGPLGQVTGCYSPLALIGVAC